MSTVPQAKSVQDAHRQDCGIGSLANAGQPEKLLLRL